MIHDAVICCEVPLPNLNFPNFPGAKRTNLKTINISNYMLISSFLSVHPTAHVYMYMHCILFIHLLHVSCNFLVTVQENYKLTVLIILGDTHTVTNSVSITSISGALKHITLISLSICPLVLKTTRVVIRCFPTHSTRGITTRTHTHARTQNHGKNLFCFSRFLCFNCSMLWTSPHHRYLVSFQGCVMLQRFLSPCLLLLNAKLCRLHWEAVSHSCQTSSFNPSTVLPVTQTGPNDYIILSS